MKFKDYLTEAKEPNVPAELKKAVKFIISKGYKFHSTENTKSRGDTVTKHRFVNSDNDAIEIETVSSDQFNFGWAVGTASTKGGFSLKFKWDGSGTDAMDNSLKIAKRNLV